MARYIHCKDCKDHISEIAQDCGELYEFIQGTALFDMLCDGACGNPTDIKKGDVCFAAVLLPNKNHFNYEIQKPENWAHKFIKGS